MKSYILLDKSGSMSSNWAETLGALNQYAKKMAEADGDTKITVAAFDSGSFDVIRDHVKAKKWSDITEDDARPGAMTPLLDSIGKLDALQKAKKRASFLILTDGLENASREMKRDDVKAVIERWKSAGYDVVFMGADFDAFGQAGSIGVAAGQTLNLKKSNVNVTMDSYVGRTVAYAASGNANVDWSDEDRAAAAAD